MAGEALGGGRKGKVVAGLKDSHANKLGIKSMRPAAKVVHGSVRFRGGTLNVASYRANGVTAVEAAVQKGLDWCALQE
eukprot:11866718-Alexandrium_andersonii.AAC.1